MNGRKKQVRKNVEPKRLDAREHGQQVADHQDRQGDDGRVLERETRSSG